MAEMGDEFVRDFGWKQEFGWSTFKWSGTHLHCFCRYFVESGEILMRCHQLLLWFPWWGFKGVWRVRFFCMFKTFSFFSVPVGQYPTPPQTHQCTICVAQPPALGESSRPISQCSLSRRVCDGLTGGSLPAGRGRTSLSGVSFQLMRDVNDGSFSLHLFHPTRFVSPLFPVHCLSPLFYFRLRTPWNFPARKSTSDPLFLFQLKWSIVRTASERNLNINMKLSFLLNVYFWTFLFFPVISHL